MRSIQQILDSGNMNHLGNAARDARLGTLLGLIPKFALLTVASNVGVLPDNAKAAAILRCYVTAGTTTGYMTPSNLATPTTGLVGISATGNILFAAADAVTQAQVVYLSHEGEVIEEIVSVASNSGTLLGGRNAFLLLEATSTVGTLTADMTVTARAATPTTGLACLAVTGAAVTFAAADAVTQARVKYIAFPVAGAGTAVKTANLGY
jgi:hypothetical protein